MGIEGTKISQRAMFPAQNERKDRGESRSQLCLLKGTYVKGGNNVQEGALEDDGPRLRRRRRSFLKEQPRQGGHGHEDAVANLAACLRL
jgi:hypothetical protein